MNIFKKKAERPFIKLCEKCHGKGQTSYFDTNQQKKYGACDQCSKHQENSRFGLGIKLKCVCQDGSSTYDWIFGNQIGKLAHVAPEMRALERFQKELGGSGNAILLDCDCGAKYLCVEQTGDRRLISPDKPYNEIDKKHNKDIAQALVDRGIEKVLVSGRPNP